MIFGDFEGAWENWCASPEGVQRYGAGNRWVCNRDLPGPKPDAQSTGPTILGQGVLFEPWTDQGQFLRWQAAGLIPNPAEYLPVTIQDGLVTGGLWVTMYSEPIRFAHLTGMAQFIPGIGTAWMAGGFAIAAIEVAKKAFADFARQNPQVLTKMSGYVQTPDEYALDQTWLQMLKPALKDAGEFVIKIITMGPWTGIALHGMQVESRNPKNPPVMRAVFHAIASKPELIGFVQGGTKGLQQAGSLGAIGKGLEEGARLVASQGAAPDIFNLIAGMGRSLYIFREPVAALFRDVPEGRGPMEAIDLAFQSAFGVRFSQFKALGLSMTTLAKQGADNVDQKDGRALVGTLGTAADSVDGTLKTLNVNFGFFEEIFRPLLDLVGVIVGYVADYDAASRQPVVTETVGPVATRPNASGARAVVVGSPTMPPVSQPAQPGIIQVGGGSGAASLIGTGGVRPVTSTLILTPTPAGPAARVVLEPAVPDVPVVYTPPKPPEPGMAPKPKGGLGLALAGAGAGFVVGGPPGAVLGLVAGLLLKGGSQ